MWWDMARVGLGAIWMKEDEMQAGWERERRKAKLESR
jgi:hypothetical protein